MNEGKRMWRPKQKPLEDRDQSCQKLPSTERVQSSHSFSPVSHDFRTRRVGITVVIAFHEKAGRSQVGSFCFFVGQGFSPAESPSLSPPFHPHSSMSDLFRSVQVGCSRFSRCCHLIIDLSSVSRRKWARRLAQSPELGAWAFVFSFRRRCLTLCCRRQRCRVAVAQRFVHFSAHPQPMQQDRQLSRRSNDRSFLPVLSATLGQLQAPPSQITARSKRTQNVVPSLYQQRSQIRIAFFADVHLRFTLSRVPSS